MSFRWIMASSCWAQWLSSDTEKSTKMHHFHISQFRVTHIQFLGQEDVIKTENEQWQGSWQPEVTQSCIHMLVRRLWMFLSKQMHPKARLVLISTATETTCLPSDNILVWNTWRNILSPCFPDTFQTISYSFSHLSSLSRLQSHKIAIPVKAGLSYFVVYEYCFHHGSAY